MARLLIDVVDGVKKHFPNRAGEWWCAAMLTDWGIRVAWPGDLFAAAAFQSMEWLIREQSWGILAAIIGVARLIALIVNGTFHDRLWYSRWSPHIRAGMSFMSVFVWSMIALGVAQSGVNTTDLAIYPYLAAFDIFNAVRAGTDAAKMDRSLGSAGRIATHV